MLKESWKREGFRDTKGKETYERSAEKIKAGDNGMWMTGRSGEDKEIFILVILIVARKRKVGELHCIKYITIKKL